MRIRFRESVLGVSRLYRRSEERVGAYMDNGDESVPLIPSCSAFALD
jgi:hypothetical protein